MGNTKCPTHKIIYNRAEGCPICEANKKTEKVAETLEESLKNVLDAHDPLHGLIDCGHECIRHKASCTLKMGHEPPHSCGCSN